MKRGEGTDQATIASGVVVSEFEADRKILQVGGVEGDLKGVSVASILGIPGKGFAWLPD